MVKIFIKRPLFFNKSIYQKRVKSNTLLVNRTKSVKDTFRMCVGEDGIDIFQEKGNWEWDVFQGNKMENFVLRKYENATGTVL